MFEWECPLCGEICSTPWHQRRHEEAGCSRETHEERQEAHASKIKQLKDAAFEMLLEWRLGIDTHYERDRNNWKLAVAVDAYEEALRSLSVEGVVE